MSTVYDEKLLDKVGLAMVPSGYTNNAADEGNAGGALGKVYSVLPIQTTSDNLVTNGTFDTDSDWNKGTGWTIENGVATSTGTAGFTYLSQGNVNTGHKEGKGILTLTISGCTNFSQAGIVVEATPGGSGIARNFNTLRDSGVVLENGIITFTEFSNYRPNLSFWNNTGSPLSIDNISYQVITDGDFDFSRGSDATRVNSQGYIESVQVLSDELVQNGDFEDVGSELVQNGDFEQIGSEININPTADASIPYGDVGSGYSDEDGTDQVYFYNGGIKTERLRTGNLRLRLAKSNGVSSGLVESNKVYKVTFDVIEADFNGDGSSNIQFYFDGNTPFATISETPASYEFYVKSGSVGNGIAQWSFSNQNIGYYVVYDNISVKEVGQNWTFGDSWNMGDGVAVSDGSSSNSNFTYQNILTLGRAYKVTLDVVLNSGNLNAYVTSGITQSITSSGTYTFYGVCDRTDLDLHLKAVNFDGSVDNVSVKEVGQNWIFPTGWSLESDGGNLKAVANGTNAFLEQASVIQPIQANTSYRVKFSLSDYVAGVLRVAVGGYTTGPAAYKNGNYTIDVVSNSSSNTRIYLYAQGTCDFAVDNISIKEITDDTDIPRLDYTNSACPSLLLEPERTNLFTHSEYLNAFPWNSYVAAFIDDNVTTSPEGFLNASLLREDTTNNSHFVYKDFNLTNGSTYTISIFAKSNGENRNLRFGDGGVGWSSGWGSANFDLTNGTSDSGTIENYGNGWYRCSVTGTTNATSSRLIIYSTLNNTTTYQGDGLSGVYIWGMQVEEGSYPTSYIPTNGLLVTREADVCNNAGDSTIFNNSEGVLFADISNIANDATLKRISISDGTNNNRIMIGYNNANNSYRVFVVSGGTLVFDFTGYFESSLRFNKIALKYKENDFSVWVNGNKTQGDTSGAAPTGTLKQMQFASGANSGSDFYGNCRQVIYFNEALSDAELEYITSADIDLTIHNYKGSLSKISATYEDVGVKDRLTKLF